MPYACTTTDLKDGLERYGLLTTGVTMPKGEGGRANKGYAYIDVADSLAAHKALLLDGEARIQGRILRVDEAGPLETGGWHSEESALSPTRRISLRNLSYECTDAQLRGVVEGSVLSFRKPR